MKKQLLFVVLLISNVLNAQFNTLTPRISTKDIAIHKPQIKEEKKETQEDTIAFLPLQATAKKYISLPLDTIIITSPYGERVHPIKGIKHFHTGVDLRCNNAYIYSIMPGFVLKAGSNRSIGHYVMVEHGDIISIYGHLHTVFVRNSQVVEAGQPIGISGNTGVSTAPHLHFAVKMHKKYIDPTIVLNYIKTIGK